VSAIGIIPDGCAEAPAAPIETDRIVLATTNGSEMAGLIIFPSVGQAINQDIQP
jgi:hypothetical protein